MVDDLFNTQIPVQEVVLRLLMASVFGMVLGWERERRNKPAGLRTHMMVCLGSAAFFVIALEFLLGPLKDYEDIRPDPMRIIEGVIGGIGFLGAGSIIQARGSVRGLTTGASIWAAGAVGLACGGGYYLVATIVTLIAFIILFAVGLLEHRFFQSSD